MDIKNMDLYKVRCELSSGKSIYDLPLRVTYYARVSTDKYEQLNSLDNQVNYYEELIKNNPNWEYVHGYIDEGLSGTSTKKRDSFNNMLKDAQMKKFDLIITKEISRFSRNTLDSIKYTQELLSNNIGVYFECDNINTYMPDSELRLTIMASLAQEEVRKISERVKFGFQRSIKKGRVLGSSDIWGYKKDDGRLIIVPEEAKMIKEIFEMYTRKRIGMKSIGIKLFEKGYKTKTGKPFSANTISGILRNPKYKGYYCGNKTKIVDYRLKTKINVDKKEWLYYKDDLNVPPIVSEEIWEEAQNIIESKNKKIKNYSVFSNRHSLSGKIICKEHNTTFRRKVNISSGRVKRKKIIWVCGIYSKEGIKACNSPLLHEEELKILIANIVNNTIQNEDIIIDSLINEYKENYSTSKIKVRMDNKTKALESLNRKKNSLLELKLDNEITKEEFSIKNNKLNLDIINIKNEIDELNVENNNLIFKEKNINELKNILNKELIFTKENCDEAIYDLVDKIYVTKIDNDRKKLKLDIYFKKNIKPKSQYFYPYYTHDKSRC